MSFNQYYERELVALRVLGKEYSERNPALAPFLDTPGRDPDVERLLEGFSFLTGRLQQKLDDELPEITHALFNLLWPNYLRPIPSCSIIKYTPTANVSGSVVIPKGTVVESEQVNGTNCKFRTVYETEVLPVELGKLSFVTEDGKAFLRLDFSLVNAALENTHLSKLRLFLTGEPAIVHTLYYYLVRKARSVLVTAQDSVKKEHILAKLGPEQIRAVGFEEQDILLPYPANSFPGYRIIQEYFCFPEKFHFIDILGLEKAFNRERLASMPDNEGTFSLHIELAELPENFEAMRKENIQLYCTPVINLFSKSATPITFDHKQPEYRIVPDPRQPYNYSVYSVTRVSSWSNGRAGDYEYKLFESFDHLNMADNTSAFYRLRIHPAVKDESIETWISIIHKGTKAHSQNETISMELLCTNRMLPTQLGVGDITIPADKSDAPVVFKNIIRVTPPYMPPLEGDILWRLLSNMALNYIPLTNIQALRGILTTYDFRALHDSRRARVLDQIMQGMVTITSSETDRIYKGLPIRGSVTRLVLNERKFSCEGDMYLFSSVLNEFLAMYATVNSFHQLTVEEEKSGETYAWPPRLGARSL